MLTALRRLFRRVPPHLAGRVPVDAGEGVAASEYFVTTHSVCRLSQKDRWGHLTLNASYIGAGLEPWTAEAYERHREEKGRAFTPAPPLPSGARPDWAVRDVDMERARIREAERARERQASREIPSEVRMAMDKAASMHSGRTVYFDVVSREVRVVTPNGEETVCTELEALASKWELRTYRECDVYKPRPAPAENAKRYTREDGTW